jgi:heptosyltransferase-3
MKILIYQIGQLGDTIVSIPALRAVRQHFGPHCHISLLHDATHRLVTSETVLEGTGLVDQFIPYTPTKSVGSRLRTMVELWRRLRRERFDAAFSVLPSDRPRTALVRDRLFFRACGISRLIGFRPYEESEFRPRTSAGRPAQTPNEAIFRLRRLFAENIGLTSGNLLAQPLISIHHAVQARVDQWLANQRNHPERPLIALCPGGKKPANSWPIERFLDIAEQLRELRRFEIVLIGGPAERGLADFLRDGLDGDAIHAAGRFSVTESAALLSRCSLLIGLDTGTSHLAAAVGTPCVVVQSANSFPGHWDPLGEHHKVIRADVPCAGCLLQSCPREGHPCMNSLSVDLVWNAVDAVLSSYESHARHSHV